MCGILECGEGYEHIFAYVKIRITTITITIIIEG